MRLLLCWLFFYSAAITAGTTEWRLYKEVEQISVEYRHNINNIMEVRAQTEVTSSVAAFLHLLEDTANIRRWAANTEKAELLGQPDSHTHIVHTYFSAIWPVSKRDIVTQSIWTQDTSSGVLIIQVTDLGQHYPAVKGYVRMQQVQGTWTLTPLAGSKLRLQYQGQADASGKLPHFIGDKVALKSLFKTFAQLPAVLAEYQQSYPGVQNSHLEWY